VATFAYIAVDAAGQKQAGTLDAEGRPAVLRQLRDRGLTPVSVAAAQAQADSRRGGRRALSNRAAEDFCRELSNLLAAGISMSRALSILCRQTRGNNAAVMNLIHEEVSGGSTLAAAMGKCEGSFSPVQIAMVQAGETGGFLDVVLGQIADFQSRERDLKGRIKSALAYPAVLVTVSVGVLTFLLTYFIPKFTEMFKSLGGSLPALTQVIVAVSNAIVHHGPIVLIVLVVGIVALRYALRTPAGRLRMQRLILATPGIGRVVARLALVRFSRMLGTLIAAGVPLVASLKVAREAIGNQVLSDAMKTAIEDVVRGRSLSRSLAGCPRLFPPAVVETLAVAEEAGRLDAELQRLATVHDQELDRRLRLLISLAEPLVLFIMAVLVGLVVVGMLLPIFSIQDLIR
jgi:type IV pilus assembly protein PilC